MHYTPEFPRGGWPGLELQLPLWRGAMEQTLGGVLQVVKNVIIRNH